MHRRGVLRLSYQRLRHIFQVLHRHHSKDQTFLNLISETMADNAPWRCLGCKQLRKHSANHCHVCQQPWQVAMDRTYVHQPGGQKSQEMYASGWNYNQGWEGQQNWGGRDRSQSRTHTPKKGRKPKGAKTPRNNGPGEGKGVPMMPFPAAPSFGKGQPLPPPPMPWPGYSGIPQPMMMQPPMQPMTTPVPTMPQHPAPPQLAQMMAPVAPPFSAPPPPQTSMSSEQMEFIEMARARQSELPADMRHQMQKMAKKEGARATKDLHSAVKQLGIARAEVEEAIQARINLIASWKNFLSEAVKTWQDYTVLFQTQERGLQARIQEAQENFAQAKIQAAESQAVAGKLTIEIKDEDDDFTEGQETTNLSAGKINEGLATLSASLQQMKEQADAIVVEENAAKRQRTSHQGDQAMDVGGLADSNASSKPPFASPGCP